MGAVPARRTFDTPYLTDGTRLFEVVGAAKGVLILKDSAAPDGPEIRRSSSELKGLRTVRPN